MDSNLTLNYSLDEGAYAPEKAHDSDAGFDLRVPSTASAITMGASESRVIDTGVHVQIPEGYCGLLVSKSGLNVKQNITSTGLIDAGYEGSIKVKLYRQCMPSEMCYTIEPGDKITQLVILPIPTVNLNKVDSIENNSDRGSNGFGSTGR